MIGGVIGFARKGSVPSLVGGASYVAHPRPAVHNSQSICRIGGLYFWSGRALQDGRPYGLEGALGTSTNRVHRFYTADSRWSGSSVLLLLSSAPRFSKGTVPKLLSLTSASAIVYYGRAYLDKV